MKEKNMRLTATVDTAALVWLSQKIDAPTGVHIDEESDFLEGMFYVNSLPAATTTTVTRPPRHWANHPHYEGQGWNGYAPNYVTSVTWNGRAWSQVTLSARRTPAGNGRWELTLTLPSNAMSDYIWYFIAAVGRSANANVSCSDLDNRSVAQYQLALREVNTTPLIENCIPITLVVLSMLNPNWNPPVLTPEDS